jgi:hypothetical protein
MNFVTHVIPQSGWAALTATVRAQSDLLTPAAAAALHQQTVVDTRAEDMASLAASVSAPGLKERIRLFRESRS